MRISRFVIGTLALAMLAATSASAAEVWKCTAPGIVPDYQYDGGANAYIHLTAYDKGHQYPVTKSADGKTANGTTTDGTKFTCRKQ